MHVTTTFWEGVASQWTLANFLTAVRALLVIPVVFCAFYGWQQAVVVLVVLAAATDAEGSWARWTNTTTELGRVLDPIADKVFVGMTLLTAVFITDDPLVPILWAVNLGYDIDNTTRRIGEIYSACLGQRGTEAILAVTWISKGKTVLLFVVVGALYFPSGLIPELLIHFLVVAAIVAVGYSWAHNRRATLSRLLRSR